MTYFRGRELLPAPNADDAPFWENCARKRLAFQQCEACGAFAHPPIGVCPSCQSTRRRWTEAPTVARVFSFTWIHTAAHEAVGLCLPYNVVVIEFPGLPDVRLISNVVDVRPGELKIGDAVVLVWEKAGENLYLPRFRRKS